MSRAARLLDLMQALRRYRRPVTADTLAQKLGVSKRTLYRDIATLIAEGAAIEGEAGMGYVLREGSSFSRRSPSTTRKSTRWCWDCAG